MNSGCDVMETKRQIALLHDRGAVSQEVVDVVIANGFGAPVESEIFDYKETLDGTPLATGKLIRHIVSFYNSYGGYLLFGIKETVSETQFEVVGVPDNLLDLESLKSKTREYVGERIQINGLAVPSRTAAGTPCHLFLLFIPKRPENGRPPAHFLKDGPSQIFRKDDVYYRVGDECIEAKGPKLFALSLHRPNPYLSAQATWSFDQFLTKRIENNLPDRNFICPRFVGREVYLDSLWRWLGDDLSRVKMLAGEGGLGKSSIAYEFAERVSQIQNVPFEQVIWLTAKRRQFVGQKDDFVPVPETHYSTYEELVRAILHHLPILIDQETLDALSIDDLKREVRDGLSAYPSFLVIDDIDSLEAEQQRQVVEFGFVLGSANTKLLLTTRHNLAYSHDLAIQINGFDEPEFSEYLSSLRERNILQRELNAGDRSKLHGITDGSPLYTESICRLLRFQSFNEAIKGWGKDAGTRARSAALDREVSLLSPESRRVLLGAALLSEASIPEIAEVTEYPQESVLLCIQELSSLFLLAGETLADQPRFSVPDNAVRLVTERAVDLVTDHKRLADRVRKIRLGTQTGKEKDQRVGLAISQAQALLRLGDVTGALKTVDDSRKRIKGNSDLLGFRAEVLMRLSPPKFDDARRAAREAFQNNCRRPATFFTWFEAEWAAENFIGAAEAARAAIDSSVSGTADWWVKLAAALASIAEEKNTGADLDKRVDAYFEASDAMSHAKKLVRGTEIREWERIQYDLHDRIWSLLAAKLENLDNIDIAVQAIERMWAMGDFRYSIANRAAAIGLAISAILQAPTTRKSSGLVSAADLRFKRCKRLLEMRKAKYPDDTRNSLLDQTLERTSSRFLSAVTENGG